MEAFHTLLLRAADGDVSIQGYYFSRPLPMPDYEKLLDKYPLRPH